MLSDNDVDFEYLVGGTLPAEYVETLVEQPDALDENAVDLEQIYLLKTHS